MAPKPGTLDSLASYLVTGYYADDGTTPLQWDTSRDNVITVNLTRLDDEGRALARAALDAWEMVADIRFQETTGTADITFDDSKSGANTSKSYDPRTGNLISATVNVGTSWLDQYGTTVGSYSYQTYLHEIGHALGLGHAGAYDGGASYSTATWTNDSWQLSVMSYLDQDENPGVRASKAYVVTPMMADILAIQSIYGAPSGGATAGDTTYGLNSRLGGALGGVFGSGPGSIAANALTIYDEGGTDTLDVSDDRAGQVINLNGGTFSSLYGKVDNLGIARGTTIERAFAGSGADSVTGNGAANLLKGNGGADSLFGGSGGDSLYGGDGNDRLAGDAGGDRLWGDAGDDRLEGGADSDTLYGGGGNDSLNGSDGSESLYGGDGADSLLGGEGTDRLWADAGNDVGQGGNGNDSLFGGSGNDRIYGDAGNDALEGGVGADRLLGGSGNDRLVGGEDADTLVFSAGRDVVADFRDDRDTILFDAALWGGGGLSAERILGFARIDDGDALFDFGGGNTLRVEGVANLALLLNDIATA